MKAKIGPVGRRSAKLAALSGLAMTVAASLCPASVTREIAPLADGGVLTTLTWSFASPPRSGIVLEESIPDGWRVDRLALGEASAGTLVQGEAVLRVAIGIEEALPITGSLQYVLRAVAPVEAGRSVAVSGRASYLDAGHLVTRATSGDAAFSAPDAPHDGLAATLAVAGGLELGFRGYAERDGVLYIDRTDALGASRPDWRCIWSNRVTAGELNSAERAPVVRIGRDGARGWFRVRFRPD